MFRWNEAKTSVYFAVLLRMKNSLDLDDVVIHGHMLDLMLWSTYLDQQPLIGVDALTVPFYS